jgi:hypothetical protein
MALQGHDRSVACPGCFMQEPNFGFGVKVMRKILTPYLQIMVVWLTVILLTELP